MLDKKAFTFVEIIVVTSILIGLLTTTLYFFSATRSESHNENIEQKFYELRAKLLKHIKKDVRSSTSIIKESKKSWRLEVFIWNSQNISETKIVKYRINENKSIIHRECGGKKNKYDFTNILKGKKLVFKITP